MTAATGQMDLKTPTKKHKGKQKSPSYQRTAAARTGNPALAGCPGKRRRPPGRDSAAASPLWRYSSEPNKLAWKRPFLRSQQRQGFVHGRAAGSLQPSQRLRGGGLGSEAKPLPSREQCLPQGSEGAAHTAAGVWTAAAVPPQAGSALLAPLPCSFLREAYGEWQVLESPGWSKVKGCNRIRCKEGPEMEDCPFLLKKVPLQVSKWFD
ncbi:uncharacterized protein PRD47_000079 [Ara ararauna]